MTDRYRVCHLVHHLALGGLETQVLRIIEATPDDAVSYTACYFGDDTSLRSDYEEAGVRVVGVDRGSPNPVSQLSPLTIREVVSFFREEEFDAVHVHGSLYLLVLGRICARLAGVPVVCTYHTPRDSFHPATQRLERLTRPLSAVDIAVSQDVERSYVGSARRYEPNGNGSGTGNRRGEGNGFDRGSYTIHNGIDVEEFAREVAEADPERVREEYGVDSDLVFLNIGRYTDRKNQVTLVRAMGEVVTDYPDAHLFVVGWGPEEDRLRRTAAELGIADNVSVTGRSWEVCDFYALADAFVLPSTTEGLSVVLLEAMASGLPVVGTDAPGTAEAVVDGTTGLITVSDAPGDLAAAMNRLASPDRRRRMGQAGYERARSEFSVHKTAQSYLDVYRRVA
ncbi:MAG: glycosyltransferase family 4 protein [Haloarculaceae archaeon]